MLSNKPLRYEPPTSELDWERERERERESARCTHHTTHTPSSRRARSPSVTTDSPPIHHRLPHPGMADGFTPSWQCYITPLTSSSVRQVS